MENYQLSDAAISDLDALYLYGILNYGLRQADDYYDGLIDKFEMLFKHPDWGNDYTFIAPNLYRYEYGSHSIYCQYKVECVLIVRVLGYQQEPARHLGLVMR